MYNIVQTIGKRIAGGDKGGCFIVPKVFIALELINAEIPPTTNGTTIATTQAIIFDFFDNSWLLSLNYKQFYIFYLDYSIKLILSFSSINIAFTLYLVNFFLYKISNYQKR